MFCVHCGADGALVFCATCGKRQGETDTVPSPESPRDKQDVPIVAELVEPSPRSSDWANSLDYDRLLHHPETRPRIERAARAATAGLTGEDLMAVFDAVSPIPISLVKLTDAVMPIYDKLGIKTDRQAFCQFDCPPGRVLLSTLCVLASHSLKIVDVHQPSDQCTLVSEIPPSLVTNRGKLVVCIRRTRPMVSLQVSTTISGQWYDWGKSSRMIDEMIQSIHRDLEAQRGGTVTHHRAA